MVVFYSEYSYVPNKILKVLDTFYSENALYLQKILAKHLYMVGYFKSIRRRKRNALCRAQHVEIPNTFLSRH